MGAVGTVRKRAACRRDGTHGIEWEQKGTLEKHLSVLDYKKQEREKAIAALDTTLAEKQDELETVQNRIDNFDQGAQSIEKLEQRIESDAEFQLPDPPALMTAKTYKQRFADPLIKRLKEIIRKMFCRYYKALDSYHRLNTTNGRLYRENEHLTATNDRLKGENDALRAYCARERPQMRCSAAGLSSQRPPNN